MDRVHRTPRTGLGILAAHASFPEALLNVRFLALLLLGVLLLASPRHEGRYGGRRTFGF
jgi:hypothetical protein